MPLRLVDVQQSILKKNVTIASALRERFAAEGTYVFNMLSSPGAGKTTLLEATLRELGSRYRVAALAGDQATENDALRLARSGAPVKQITTGAECRLDAQMIERALSRWDGAGAEVLAIENVGNLICPAEYDLGEDLRVALFSVTEGEDKPLKYPLAFNSSDIALITKIDLAGAVGFDREAATGNIRSVHPGIPIVELSTRSGAGMELWYAFLDQRIMRKRADLVAT
ncbi:MAG: hydrogenase nickel incorporation protein HypB [Candidatus Eremiobacteraeota bacterium]|nr:hydrogenase nickel incorporation protein HypB [Candidatus Eremiobacteraeota bacterium]